MRVQWTYLRDEFDLLREELDDLERAHKRVADPRVWRMQEEVLDEQADTEERFEREMTRVLGEGGVEEVQEHVCPHCGGEGCEPEELATDRPLTELLRDRPQDALYEEALAWAQQVFAWCGAQEDARIPPRDLYRIRLNVLLVPMKISFALWELYRDEPRADVMAEKEYALAQTYLMRVGESFEALADVGVEMDAPLLFAIPKLLASLQQRRDELASGFSPV